MLIDRSGTRGFFVPVHNDTVAWALSGARKSGKPGSKTTSPHNTQKNDDDTPTPDTMLKSTKDYTKTSPHLERKEA